MPIDKKKQIQSMVDTANAPMPSFGDVTQGMSDMATQAKQAVLQRIKRQNMDIPVMPTQNRSPEEDLALKMKGAQTMERSKAQDANNVINRTEQEISDLESMAQFGDKDAEAQIASKKELLRKYLMNNR